MLHSQVERSKLHNINWVMTTDNNYCLERLYLEDPLAIKHNLH